jgi:putative ABC transport system ATP-binding protein
MALVELKNVHKSYAMGQRSNVVLKGVDIEVTSGEVIGVWGPSGSGKSTLCNIIGLLDTPDTGQVLFQNQDISQLDDDAISELRNKSIGFVFQRFNLIPVLSALENVMLPLEVLGTPREQAEAKGMERLQELGIDRYAATRPDQMSGGEQQRVAIARALVTDPALLIADEPTANLDTSTAMQIMNLMAKLNESRDTTLIFATHDSRLLDYVNRKVMLDDGVIVEDKIC